jgi:phage terminase small subunit
MNTKLTAKQRTFIEEYLIDLNATQAAIRAGYSKKTAQQVGSQNLSKLVIQTAIQKAMNQRSKSTGITAAKVLDAIAEIGFADFNEDIRASDKLKALELMARHLGMFDNIAKSQRPCIITMNYGGAQPTRVMTNGVTIEGEQAIT